MQLTAGLKQFIRAHLTDNTDKLLLAASRFPGIDIRFAIDQIIARRQIQHKLPFWYEQDELIYPSRLSTEQNKPPCINSNFLEEIRFAT